jgi:hypothetical protein
MHAQIARSWNLTAADLNRRTKHRRAIEAVIWGVPAVNYDLMYQATVRETRGAFNQIVYWSRLPDWRNQTLTPNPDAIYLMPFVNTRSVGPVVLEIPPADGGVINGSVMDCWQTAIEDVGPAGVDKGKGGKFLILPPDYKNPLPEGYVPMPSPNFQSYALLRSILRSGSEADVAAGVAYGKRIRLYPLSQASNPSPTVFVDAADVVFDSTIPYNLRFFQSLHRMIQTEPWLTRDKVMIDQLKSIGIEKGKPFEPDLKTKEILEDAIREARAWIDVRYETILEIPFNPGTHWAMPASRELVDGLQSVFTRADSYPVEARGLAYSFAFFSAKHLGSGQFYLMTIKDKDGQPLNGVNNYRLTIPPNAPVTQYWSATAYDRATHALIRYQRRSSRSSQNPELQKNPDGSADVYFGPKAPSGKESNWVPTSTHGMFEVLFRFYGPEKALFDKTWTLPDIEKI